MRIPIDRESPLPVHRQIQQFIEAEIRSGALPMETRLPASRELAAGLGVNRLTITNAYGELEAAGLIYSRQGSETYVAPSPAALPNNGGDGSSPADWPLWQQELLSRTWLPSGRGLDQYAHRAPSRRSPWSATCCCAPATSFWSKVPPTPALLTCFGRRTCACWVCRWTTRGCRSSRSKRRWLRPGPG